MEFVRSRSTRSAKKARMGSHPKYEGNLTTYIHNGSERKDVMGVIGRVMKNNGGYTRSHPLICLIICNCRFWALPSSSPESDDAPGVSLPTNMGESGLDLQGTVSHLYMQVMACLSKSWAISTWKEPSALQGMTYHYLATMYSTAILPPLYLLCSVISV
jgi:hypothetical protein